ncbi:hypothetical protein HY086_02125 [Candidatus Gottesmanbacteria bacterium]|nr:hypothetical protein [Candidatus Gottesmanbacteria bacterium]
MKFLVGALVVATLTLWFFFQKTSSGPKFLSSPTNPGIVVRSPQDSSVVIWQDGPFLYKATKGTTQKTTPFSVIGTVKKIKERVFEIESGSYTLSVKLSQGGSVILAKRKEGELAEEKEVPINHIIVGSKVEFHLLTDLGSGQIGSRQVYLLAQ